MKPFLFFISLSIIFTNLYAQTKKDSLLVFVGERISVEALPQENEIVRGDTVIENGDTSIVLKAQMSMDTKYAARYKVLKKLYGSFKTDTIEFLAFDHYGYPAFSNYKTVLLYVSIENGILVHEKYQFTDVYKTKDGRWASGYRVEDYAHEFNKNTNIKPQRIRFVKPVYYDLEQTTSKQIAEWFPSPYYFIQSHRATVVYGNYIEQLFELKKAGILKARGIF